MNAVSALRSNGHLLRCQSVLRAHVRLSTLRAQGLSCFAARADDVVSIARCEREAGSPCIWPSP
jgi:hypothetical protein